MQLHDAPDAHRSAWLDLHDGHMRLQYDFYWLAKAEIIFVNPGYPSTNLADLCDHIRLADLQDHICEVKFSALNHIDKCHVS